MNNTLYIISTKFFIIKNFIITIIYTILDYIFHFKIQSIWIKLITKKYCKFVELIIIQKINILLIIISIFSQNLN